MYYLGELLYGYKGFNEDSAYYKYQLSIIVQFMTMREKQISARAIEIQKEN